MTDTLKASVQLQTFMTK